MSQVHEALNDINWLSKRLKGIITLSEEIDTYDTLKTQTEEMKSSLSTLKNQLEDMNQKATDHSEVYKNMVLAYEKEHKALETKSDAIIAQAHTEAQSIKSKAEQVAKALRDAAQQDKLSIDKEIEHSKVSLAAVGNDIKNSMDYHSKLQQDIANLKAKF